MANTLSSARDDDNPDEQFALTPSHPDSPPTDAADPETFPPLPALRLHHLFALTAVAAILLGMMGPGNANSPLGTPFGGRDSIVFVGLGIANTILGAVAITFVAYGIAWRRRGIPFFHQPGHWLLVDLCFVTMLTATLQLGVRLIFQPLEERAVALPTAVFWLATLFSLGWILGRIVFDIYVGIKKCSEPRWKWVFFTRAIAVIVQLLGDLVAVLLLLRAAAVDRRKRIYRDAGHRCGVWLQIASTCIMLLSVAAGVYQVFSDVNL